MTIEQNKQIVSQYITAFHESDLDTLQTLLTPELLATTKE